MLLLLGLEMHKFNYHSGSWCFHLSLTASTSIPHNSALLTIAFAFPTTGASIIFPSKVHAPLPPASAFSSPITTLIAHSTSFSPGANALCATSTWLGWIHCFPLNPNPFPCRHSSSNTRRPSGPRKEVHTKSIVDGNSCARAAVAIADLAYRNSASDGVLVSDRSSAKSSAAKINPLKYGDDLHISPKFMTDSADSTRAMIFSGLGEAAECRAGRV